MTEVAQLTIDQALDAFLAEQHERLAPSTYERYAQVVGLLRCCLDEYGYSSLATVDQARWRDAVEAGDEQAFCRLFGAERIAAQLTGFLDWFMIRKGARRPRARRGPAKGSRPVISPLADGVCRASTRGHEKVNGNVKVNDKRLRLA